MISIPNKIVRFSILSTFIFKKYSFKQYTHTPCNPRIYFVLLSVFGKVKHKPCVWNVSALFSCMYIIFNLIPLSAEERLRTQELQWSQQQVHVVLKNKSGFFHSRPETTRQDDAPTSPVSLSPRRPNTPQRCYASA